MAISDFSESERQERKLYRPLLSERRQIDASSHWKTVFLVVSTVLIFAAILYFGEMYSDVESSDLDDHEVENAIPSSVVDIMPISRGESEGVSEKVNQLIRSVKPYDWTNAMLKWQRTGYHFQPEKNWMNDPNGPLHHKGWYHLFYQYNPDSAVWGNITWGHAISKDLIHWLYLDLAMVPDHWYDINGVWTGSATILPDGNIIMIYTGSTNQSVQVQNVAFPKNISDPLLLDWVKYSGNPVLTPPKGINYTDFRDPTTAWYVDSDGSWRITIGSKINKTGLALVYETKDFLSYELLDGVLHSVAGTGMWECIDFYPVSQNGSSTGLDTSVYGDGVKHVMKASMDDTRYDTYAIGHYNETTNIWTPDNPEIDVGIGLRYDFGLFYASKTFYDPVKQRRVLWGWINEGDSEQDDLTKGWASLQGIPRQVWFDSKTGDRLIQWPVEEVDSLRKAQHNFGEITMEAGTVVPLSITPATQLDINIEMEFPTSENSSDSDSDYTCFNSGGASDRGLLGPFGLLVLAEKNLTEQTAVFFYVAKTSNGYKTYFCHDETRSSLATDLVLRTYGTDVPVISGEKLSLRILVDHSIVESFAQGGRQCITSRVYPTQAIYDAARVFLFNNATSSITVTKFSIWELDSANLHNYSE